MSARSPRQADLPEITVAILSYNRHDQLAVTLSTLMERLTWPAERLEIVVVDNASTDGTGVMVRQRFPSVRLIENDRNEGVGGWNRAFAEGSGEYFLVL